MAESDEDDGGEPAALRREPAATRAELERALAEANSAVGSRREATAMAESRSRRAQGVDRAVARRVRRRRLELAMTLRELADLVGVAYQQLHNYETGHNRVPAGSLYRMARALGVGVGHFFQDHPGHEGPARAEPPEAPGRRRALLELARHVAAIRNPRHRAAVCQLARELAALGDDPAGSAGRGDAA